MISFGQPGSPQSFFFVSREIFSMPIRAQHVFETGNTQRGIEAHYAVQRVAKRIASHPSWWAPRQVQVPGLVQIAGLGERGCARQERRREVGLGEIGAGEIGVG
jgi:hypothetical protein